MPPDAHLADDVAVGIEADRAVDELRGGLSRRQVDEDADRVRQPLVVERGTSPSSSMTIRTASGSTTRRMSLIVTTRGAAARLVPVVLTGTGAAGGGGAAGSGGGAGALAAASGRFSIDATADGTCFANLLRRILRRDGAQQPDRRGPVLGGAEPVVGIQRQLAAAPQRVVAVARWSETAGRSLRSRRRPCAPP